MINALKHAFPNDRSGKKMVGYHSAGPEWTLMVGDDGVGMAEGATEAKPGLDTSIVTMLARQQHADVTVAAANPGTTVSVVHTKTVEPDGTRSDPQAVHAARIGPSGSQIGVQAMTNALEQAPVDCATPPGAKQNAPMARFFFDTDDGDRFEADGEGSELLDRAAVRGMVMVVLPDMLRSLSRSDRDRRDLTVDVRDDQGRLVYRAVLSLNGEWTT